VLEDIAREAGASAKSDALYGGYAMLARLRGIA
jgi:hypothetical protein